MGKIAEETPYSMIVTFRDSCLSCPLPLPISREIWLAVKTPKPRPRKKTLRLLLLPLALIDCNKVSAHPSQDLPVAHGGQKIFLKRKSKGVKEGLTIHP